jgi:hypothetical protein
VRNPKLDPGLNGPNRGGRGKEAHTGAQAIEGKRRTVNKDYEAGRLRKVFPDGVPLSPSSLVFPRPI